jgi:hypothetical protein
MGRAWSRTSGAAVAALAPQSLPPTGKEIKWTGAAVVSHFECNSRKTAAVRSRATPETALKRST